MLLHPLFCIIVPYRIIYSCLICAYKYLQELNVEKLEQKINCGQVEEVIKQVRYFFKNVMLVLKMLFQIFDSMLHEIVLLFVAMYVAISSDAWHPYLC